MLLIISGVCLRTVYLYMSKKIALFLCLAVFILYGTTGDVLPEEQSTSGTLPHTSPQVRKDKQLKYLCPWPFNPIGGMCLYANCDTSQEFDWQEARMFCREIGGDLAIIADGCQLADAIWYVTNLASSNPEDPEGKCNYWIGGSDADTTASNEDNWRWINGLPMPKGSPFWAPNLLGTDTAPETGENLLDFAYLAKDSFYLIKDEDPLFLRESVGLCQAAPYWSVFI